MLLLPSLLLFLPSPPPFFLPLPLCFSYESAPPISFLSLRLPPSVVSFSSSLFSLYFVPSFAPSCLPSSPLLFFLLIIFSSSSSLYPFLSSMSIYSTSSFDSFFIPSSSCFSLFSFSLFYLLFSASLFVLLRSYLFFLPLPSLSSSAGGRRDPGDQRREHQGHEACARHRAHQERRAPRPPGAEARRRLGARIWWVNLRKHSLLTHLHAVSRGTAGGRRRVRTNCANPPCQHGSALPGRGAGSIGSCGFFLFFVFFCFLVLSFSVVEVTAGILSAGVCTQLPCHSAVTLHLLATEQKALRSFSGTAAPLSRPSRPSKTGPTDSSSSRGENVE